MIVLLHYAAIQVGCEQVSSAAVLLSSCRVRWRYVFVSVHLRVRRADAEPLARIPPRWRRQADPTTEVIDGATYGGLKAPRAIVVLGAFGNRATIVRLWPTVGAEPSTGPLLYWPRRIARKRKSSRREIPAAGENHRDARDPAAFTLQFAERDVGHVHATGPGALLDGRLAQPGIAVGSTPASRGRTRSSSPIVVSSRGRGFHWDPGRREAACDLDVGGARSGLRFRPLAETARRHARRPADGGGAASPRSTRRAKRNCCGGAGVRTPPASQSLRAGCRPSYGALDARHAHDELQGVAVCWLG